MTSRSSTPWKRPFDLLIVLPGLIIVGPLLLLISFLIWASIGRPVLYRQARPGLNGSPFRIIKFRTMTEDRDEQGAQLPDEKRMTRFGRFLRATSLDELPELFNVLRGDMSLVGPRPLLMQYLDRYTPKQARRMEVRPGITGWAQVNGRNALSWKQKFEYDVWYVDNLSLWLDLKILLLTVWQVIAGKGVSAEGHATMPEFMGGEGE
jgi:lipopolysaccharide/colanic/teichoic acid biosynthesis glycosyltransferase